MFVVQRNAERYTPLADIVSSGFLYNSPTARLRIPHSPESSYTVSPLSYYNEIDAMPEVRRFP